MFDSVCKSDGIRYRLAEESTACSTSYIALPVVSMRQRALDGSDVEQPWRKARLDVVDGIDRLLWPKVMRLVDAFREQQTVQKILQWGLPDQRETL